MNPRNFELKSKAFSHNQQIPDEYTCKGKEHSPPLYWNHAPENTKSYALIMDDLDTPIKTLTHWILFNIPSDETRLEEGVSSKQSFDHKMMQGKNSMRKNEYMGPCPPFGSHKYQFTLYALDTVLEENPKMNKKKLLKEMNDHILAQTSLIGVYSKK